MIRSRACRPTQNRRGAYPAPQEAQQSGSVQANAQCSAERAFKIGFKAIEAQHLSPIRRPRRLLSLRFCRKYSSPDVEALGGTCFVQQPYPYKTTHLLHESAAFLNPCVI